MPQDDATELKRLQDVRDAYGDEDGPFDRAMRTYMMRTLEVWWRPGAILQVGCSHGDQTTLLKRRFDDVSVLEPMQAFIDKARAKAGAGVAFHCDLIETFKPPRTYDNILLSHVLEHVEDPVACIAKLMSWLSDGGRLFLVVPNGGAASRRIAAKMGLVSHLEGLSAADRAAGHRRVYQLDGLCRDARDAGARLAHSGGIFFKPLANFQFDALMGGKLISDAFMEGCYQLGAEHPTMSASVFVVAERG